MRRIILAGTAALALAACGSGGDDAAAPQDDAAAAVPVADVELPEGFTVYPGATVVSSTVVNATDGGGAMVLIQSAAPPADLADFYRRQAQDAGITIAMDETVKGNAMLNGEGPGGLTFSFSASPNGDGTSGQLIVGRGS